MKKPKLIVITGPTSSGKTDMSVILAREFNGEIISADSRQVYRGLDIGTNKITEEEKQGIAHHLIDVKDPSEQMTLAEYKEMTDAVIADIASRGKVPFLVGGSPLYVRAVVYNYQIPKIAPDEEYRQELEKMSLEDLLAMLKEMDSEAFEVIDKKNKRRVVRAIEVAREGGRKNIKGDELYDVLLLAPEWSREELYKRVDTCLDARIERGLIDEVKALLSSGHVTEERLEGFGLEYRFVTRYLRGEFTCDEMIKKLKYAIHDFVRRQLVWFRKEPRIHWVKNIDEARRLVKDFQGQIV